MYLQLCSPLLTGEVPRFLIGTNCFTNVWMLYFVVLHKWGFVARAIDFCYIWWLQNVAKDFATLHTFSILTRKCYKSMFHFSKCHIHKKNYV
jgi:hypothetical protein